MNELKPCPFCGSEAETFEASEDSFSILCTGCGVETPYLPYLTEAIAAWNRRVDTMPVVRGEWEPANPICPVCGEDKFKGLDADIWSDWTPAYCPNCGAKMEDKP